MAEIRKHIGRNSATNGGAGDIPTPFRNGRMSASALRRIAAAQRRGGLLTGLAAGR